MPGPLLVVTGGFHSSALAARLEGFRDCPGTGELPSGPADAQPPAEIHERGIALTSYSYERLDNLAGYDAGMPSPGFYEHVWQTQRRGEAFAHQPLLRQVVQELRDRKQRISTADLIAVETSARALAAIRGRRRRLAARPDRRRRRAPWSRTSWNTASARRWSMPCTRSSAASGAADSPPATRLPPLVVDLQRQLQAADLELTRGVRTIELNLLEAADRTKSRLLHSLAVLGIAGYKRTAGTDFLARQDLARLWEEWRLAWSPEFEATSIEAARYGTSLADAVAARLSELAAADERSAATAAALLVQAAQAGVQAISTPLLARLEGLIQNEAEFTAAAAALGHLLFLYCHDEAFGTAHLPRIGKLLSETFTRSLWLLESLGQSTTSSRELLAGLRTLLEAHERAGDVLAASDGELAAVLGRVESDPRKPPQLRGAAVGMLWTIGQASPDRVLSQLLLFSQPDQSGRLPDRPVRPGPRGRPAASAARAIDRPGAARIRPRAVSRDAPLAAAGVHLLHAAGKALHAHDPVSGAGPEAGPAAGRAGRRSSRRPRRRSHWRSGSLRRAARPTLRTWKERRHERRHRHQQRLARWRLVMGKGAEQLCGGLSGDDADARRLPGLSLRPRVRQRPERPRGRRPAGRPRRVAA